MTTAGDLKRELDKLPDSAQILVECVGCISDPNYKGNFGIRFQVVEAFAIGYRTDDPGLVLKVLEE